MGGEIFAVMKCVMRHRLTLTDRQRESERERDSERVRERE